MSSFDRFSQSGLARLPKKWLSHTVGHWAQKKPPRWLNQKMIETFAKTYNINVAEAEKPLDQYQSLSEFFSRKLRPGARPIEGKVVAPCDGQMIRSGFVTEGQLIQAKGRSFSLKDFVPQNPWEENFLQGVFATYYLSPKDYHRVHAPVSGQICWAQVIPGDLWPVNGWSVRNVDQLYAVNERVAVGLETEFGFCIVVMVGATNVGSISLAFDSDIKTNERLGTSAVFRQYPEGPRLDVGDEMGTFHLGSTAVVIFDSSFGLKPLKKESVQLGQKVKGSPQ